MRSECIVVLVIIISGGVIEASERAGFRVHLASVVRPRPSLIRDGRDAVTGVGPIQMSSIATMGNGASEATGLNVDSDRAPSRAKFANSSGSERMSGRARRRDEVHTLTTFITKAALQVRI